VTAALPPTAAGKPIEIWFQDEARVGQQGTLTRIWARRGSRPRKPRDRRYTWAYLFGAVCPARRTGAAVVLPRVSTAAMNEHLAEISTQVAHGPHAVVVLDGAGWHKPGGELQLPTNLTLLPLPPYAPELNPVENVWEYLRGNRLSITVWDTYDQIVEACCNAWNAFLQEPEAIASVATRNWAPWVND
jgi:hypothetical protein